MEEAVQVSFGARVDGPFGATLGGLIGLCCSPVMASTPAGSGEAGSVGKDCVWAGRRAAGNSPECAFPQPARPAARLTRATKCATLRATDIACRYNGYRPIELLRERRRIAHRVLIKPIRNRVVVDLKCRYSCYVTQRLFRYSRKLVLI
jgi:hypothetical protein